MLRVMKLRTGLPLSLAGDAPPPLTPPPLDADRVCEVCVVGAGVTGALLADNLVRDGTDTLLVDSRPFGTGTTAASTSLLLAEPDTHMEELEAALGAEKAARVHALGRDAIDELERTARSLPVDCGFRRRTVLEFASDAPGEGALRREAACRERLGIPCDRLGRNNLRDIGCCVRTGFALRSPVGGEVDAYLLTRGLVERACGAGLRVATARVGDVERTASGVVLDAGPFRVRARAVVFATGYEAHERLDAGLGTLSSTFVLATKPIDRAPGWPEGMLMWETARPYLYLRRTEDSRIIVGGLDEPSADAHRDPALIESKAYQLLGRLRWHFPEVKAEPALAWAGVFGSSVDGLPYVGRPDASGPVYYSLAYGGNGITFGVIAANLLAAELRGQPSPDAELFRFGRVPARQGA